MTATTTHHDPHPTEPDRAPSQRSRTAPRRRWPWLDRIPPVALALAGPAAAGLLLGLVMPRGPMSAVGALGAMALGGLVGVLAGIVLQSRWAMLAAPATFALVFELARLPVDGPTVDAIRFSFYGAIAFAVGRGLLALLVLLPMLLGAAAGAGMARRRAGVAGGSRLGVGLRRTVALVTTLSLVALAAAIVRPANTDAITGPDGEPLPGSVAELTRVEANGHDLGMLLRGHDTDNPVVLFLAGGPGGTEFGAMRRHLAELEQHLTVATLDQRGTGTSYAALDPTETHTVDSAVADVVAVTDYLRDRFDQDRIYLMGQSWGTILGVLTVQANPDRYLAYIGTGQMVDPAATDRVYYEDTLAWAQEQGRTGLADTLTDLGPPPYESILGYEPVLGNEHDVYPYDHSANSEGEAGFSENLIVEEYSLIDQLHTMAGFLDTYSVLYPQIQDIDFRQDVTELDVPVYLAQGRHETPGRADLADDWFAALDAPAKERVTLVTSGHRPLFEQPDEFVDFVTSTVLAQTSPTS